MLQTGLNPYGLTYWLGLQGRGTARANPAPCGLEAFIGLAEEIGAHCIEFHNAWLTELGETGAAALRERLGAMAPIISLGPPLEGLETALVNAVRMGAKTVRLGLTPVLCGDRAACGAGWSEMVKRVRLTLREFAPRAAGLGLTFAIENHQDFGSQELVDFCAEAGPNTGICLDTGNALAVGEGCISFAKRVAPMVRHVHLKDYRAQWTDEGFRLVRCAIGDGAVPFPEIAAVLPEHHTPLTASIEPGALAVRHIRLFRPEWWTFYPARTAAELGPCLANARRNRLADGADWRTPWEREDPPEAIVEYELDMIRRSAANMRALGLMRAAGANACPAASR